MADGAKLCEILHTHTRYSLILFHSRLLWQPFLAAVLAMVTEPINYREFTSFQNLSDRVLNICFVVTYLSLKYMNEPPSFPKQTPGRVQVWKMIFCHANRFTDLGAVSLLTGGRK